MHKTTVPTVSHTDTTHFLLLIGTLVKATDDHKLHRFSVLATHVKGLRFGKVAQSFDPAADMNIQKENLSRI